MKSLFRQALGLFAAATLALPAAAQEEAAEALLRKDEATLSRLARQGRGSRAAREALPRLATLYGASALERARALARGIPAARAALAELEAALVRARRRGLGEVALDLGEARSLGYYTGITFAGHAAGAGAAVASGGRYDGLLARFGRPGPAIGFAVDLEFATQALERAAGPARRARRR